MRKPLIRLSLLAGGWLCVALGALGAFLPLLPTTPFLLLAAFCFSRSSPRFHAWLMGVPAFGDAVRDWERRGVVRPRAKALAAAAILMSVGWTFAAESTAPWTRALVGAAAAGVLGFLLTRPSR